MSERARLTGRDVLLAEAAEPCPQDSCTGSLERSEFKDNDALVCEACGTPAVRVWGEP